MPTTTTTINREEIIDALLAKNGSLDRALLTRVFDFAYEAHEGQLRKSGEPYIIHPIATASTLASLKLATETVAAGLLHDVPEDTTRTLEEIRTLFGNEVAAIVDGVTKLSKLRYHENPNDEYVKNLRKLFFAMAEDIRVILVKLADRLHNMRTIQFVAPEKRARIAKETLEIYAPIANRLSIGEIKGELEDLAFEVLEPESVRWLRTQLAETHEERVKTLEKVRGELRELLTKERIPLLEIHGRAKHLYSLYQKLKSRDMDLGQIYDLVALRIIVPEVADCYRALGAIHQVYKPMIGLIKDYIATPKPNGYRSLHSTVIGSDGKVFEVQIRTAEMHEEAEHGIAAHWAYDEHKRKHEARYKEEAPRANHREVTWLRQLANWQNYASQEEFFEALKLDTFSDRIFIFSPKGDLFDLPKGATPVDFAYAVHTQVGHTCVGAKANGRITPLESELKNGDVVEIITQAGTGPSRDWLDFVKTSSARDKIRSYFNEIDYAHNIESGREALDRELKRLTKMGLSQVSETDLKKLAEKLTYHSLSDLYAAIGKGDRSVASVIHTLVPPKPIAPITPASPPVRRSFGSVSIVVEGVAGLKVTLAKCCQPIPGTPIAGYLTIEKGVSVHRADCANIVKVPNEARRTKVRWVTGIERETYPVSIAVDFLDRVGYMRDLTTVVSELGVNILEISSVTRDDLTGTTKLLVEVANLDEISTLFRRLEQVKGVTGVRRI
ncbi:MAG: bifunctional (p)ppGpp synthetase/guanosine-3',5'-bis(diphosphate) 3'-pyrophosphohydrolase [Parcubacteria group bacterium]|nr:bifunctional (p)ppGpp synthetase/guanosine-3',5'-bis(diphosphate) 3'-pyrophosphohydrolase [Parcubacteria group bacterium]